MRANLKSQHGEEFERDFAWHAHYERVRKYIQTHAPKWYGEGRSSAPGAADVSAASKKGTFKFPDIPDFNIFGEGEALFGQYDSPEEVKFREDLEASKLAEVRAEDERMKLVTAEEYFVAWNERFGQSKENQWKVTDCEGKEALSEFRFRFNYEVMRATLKQRAGKWYQNELKTAYNAWLKHRVRKEHLENYEMFAAGNLLEGHAHKHEEEMSTQWVDWKNACLAKKKMDRAKLFFVAFNSQIKISKDSQWKYECDGKKAAKEFKFRFAYEALRATLIETEADWYNGSGTNSARGQIHAWRDTRMTPELREYDVFAAGELLEGQVSAADFEGEWGAWHRICNALPLAKAFLIERANDVISLRNKTGDHHLEERRANLQNIFMYAIITEAVNKHDPAFLQKGGDYFRKIIDTAVNVEDTEWERFKRVGFYAKDSLVTIDEALIARRTREEKLAALKKYIYVPGGVCDRWASLP